ncbi:hypothetical protein GQ55_1G075800 [Panicum hallii var. hallii]|uniref:Uncharacterized protein n=1 Tax=Panicum hallii var. hallii TaxID=1504633 RepID=A0A2T7F3C7_9POAL|nr:hypothetical protein GQ55_1G075800 [Panicum hallii var. hallii]
MLLSCGSLSSWVRRFVACVGVFSSPYEMENSALQSRHRMSSISTT